MSLAKSPKCDGRYHLLVSHFDWYNASQERVEYRTDHRRQGNRTVLSTGSSDELVLGSNAETRRMADVPMLLSADIWLEVKHDNDVRW